MTGTHAPAPIADQLQATGLFDLGDDPSPDALEAVMRRLRELVDGADPVRREAVRAAAAPIFERYGWQPAVINAALAPPSTSAPSQDQATEVELEAEPDREALRAVRALDVKAEAPLRFRIEGFAPAGEPVLIAGDGGAFKTAMALAMGGAVAGGYSALDRFDAEPGPVLYVSEEDSDTVLRDRLAAICRGHGWDLERVLGNVWFLAQQGFQLEHPTAQAAIMREAKAIGAVMVVLDPLADLTGVRETNDELKPVVRFIRQLARDLAATVVVVHHAGKAVEGKRKLDRIRGASSLNQMARCIWFLESNDLGVAFDCLKMSRAERPRPFVVTYSINTESENPTLWQSARFTIISSETAVEQSTDAFILEQLRIHGTLNSSDLKRAAQTQPGISGADVSGAIKRLEQLGRIDFEPGPRNAKNWYVTLPAESRQGGQGTLPSCFELARQGQPVADDLAISLREAGSATTTSLPRQGQEDDDYEAEWLATKTGRDP